MLVAEALEILKQAGVSRLEALFEGADDSGGLELLKALDKEGNNLSLPEEAEEAALEVVWKALETVPYTFDNAGGEGLVAVDLEEGTVEVRFDYATYEEQEVEYALPFGALAKEERKTLEKALARAEEPIKAWGHLDDTGLEHWRIRGAGLTEEELQALLPLLYRLAERVAEEEWVDETISAAEVVVDPGEGVILTFYWDERMIGNERETRKMDLEQWAAEEILENLK